MFHSVKMDVTQSDEGKRLGVLPNDDKEAEDDQCPKG
jgi:hypothetical protein